MHQVPDLPSRIIVCKHGCAHVQIGPTTIVMTLDSLRQLLAVASEALDAQQRMHAGQAIATPVN